MLTTDVNDVRFAVPLYTSAEAARYLAEKDTTFRTWMKGYHREFANRPPASGASLITGLPPDRRMSEPPAPTEPPALKLFLDRSVQGRRFVEAIRLLIETINNRYGVKPAEQILDEQWIVCRHAARYVVFGNNNMPPKAMIELFTRHLPKIRLLTTEPGPWVRRIAQGGDMDKVALNCADIHSDRPGG
jgi:hypothetical protein